MKKVLQLKRAPNEEKSKELKERKYYLFMKDDYQCIEDLIKHYRNYPYSHLHLIDEDGIYEVELHSKTVVKIK